MTGYKKVFIDIPDGADKTQSHIKHKITLYKEAILFIMMLLSLKSILSIVLWVSGKSIVYGCNVAV